ncbi:hypothetical protein FEZ18_14230 [Oceanihabitans sp. IOP_32]|uniref:TolB family protein n=1 Tax=Oceanihabitans sp. IOP_32 TaxID=2529032 RepID=UPI001292F167|nr:PD40 domain-containing protein [Oceanihabitans sp. IOP_32]QFZ55878.1 hypothetical protein FEZ18_14230 [Oceanihabitans sp. IOP_32]
MKYLILITGLFIFVYAVINGSNNNLKSDKFDAINQLKTDSRKLAFQSGEFICVYSFLNQNAKKITQGFDPCISPNGKWIAYTKSSHDTVDFSRNIALISTKSGKITDLNLNNKNNFGAIFSPTGEYLAFSIFKTTWQIGLIKPDGSAFKMITNNSSNGLYAPTWGANGKYIYTHDLFNLYKFNISGKQLETYNLSKLLGDEFFFSTESRFWFTSDHKNLIFEAGINEYVAGLNTPSSAIFCYNFTTKEVKRLTKKGLCATNLWLDRADHLYYSGFENLKEPQIIYQMSLKDSIPVALFKGTHPSIGQ